MRTRRNFVKHLLSTAALVTLAACGGGGGSDDAGADVPVPDAKTGGIWAGTVTDNVFNEPQFFLGVSTDDGRFRFLSAETLGQFVGTFSAEGTSLTGGGIGVAPIGSVWLNNSPVIDVSMTGTISERANMSGDWTGSTGETGSFSFAYDAVYEKPSSLATLAGSWVSMDEFGNPDGSVTIDSAGRMDAQDANGCLYSGDVTIINATYNAYDLSLVVSNCGDFDGSYSGLGVLADTVEPDDTFIYSVDNGSFYIISEIVR